MKVYTKVVIDMRTLEVVDEESFDYGGSVAECKGGGGGGGSGKVSYPAYMETQHGIWLTDVDDYIDTAMTASPYTSALAYAPDTDLAAMDNAISAFDTVIDALDAAADYATYSDAVVAQVDTNVVSTTHIDAQIAAYAAVLDSDYDDAVAKLQSGMRDIGAAMTSSFVIAQTDLYAKKERDLTEFGKRLYIEGERQRNEMVTVGVKDVFLAHSQRVQLESDVARLTADAKRIRIVAKGEETKENYEYDELDARWDLKMTNYAAQMMASIGGGVASSPRATMSKSQSVLSGALSGAAIGANPAFAAATGGWSIAIGAGVGALVGGGLF